MDLLRISKTRRSSKDALQNDNKTMTIFIIYFRVRSFEDLSVIKNRQQLSLSLSPPQKFGQDFCVGGGRDYCIFDRVLE